MRLHSTGAFTAIAFSGVAICALVAGANGDVSKIKKGADLERACNSAAQQDREDCATFVYSSIQVTRMLLERTHYCFDYNPPDEITATQAAQIVTDWLGGHRDRGDIEASYVVGSAMRDSFPCKK